MYNRKTCVLLLFSIVILLGSFLFLMKREINYTPTSYEKELISYFKEVALQSEFGDNPQKVTKWKEPMILFIVKEGEFKIQMSAITKTINEINRLASDGFKIVLTNNILESNSILYLCSEEKVAELAPDFYKMFNDLKNIEISGFAYSEFSTENYVIDMSLIFINSEDPIDTQKSTILEEITQSLGLGFDSNRYPSSVFYQKKYEKEIEINEYSRLDKDIVRLLYSSKMKSGLDSIEVKRVIKKILKSEKN